MDKRAESKTTVRNSIRLPSTIYIRPELMSKAGPEFVEEDLSQAAGKYFAVFVC